MIKALGVSLELMTLQEGGKQQHIMNFQKVTCTEVVISITNRGRENLKQKQFNKCSEFSTNMGGDALKNQRFETQMAQTCQISRTFG